MKNKTRSRNAKKVNSYRIGENKLNNPRTRLSDVREFKANKIAERTNPYGVLNVVCAKMLAGKSAQHGHTTAVKLRGNMSFCF